MSTQILGLPELVRDGTGFLVPPHAAGALADAIEQIYRLPHEGREAMGRAGRRVAEEFEVAKGATRMLELIRAVGREQRRPFGPEEKYGVSTDVSAHS